MTYEAFRHRRRAAALLVSGLTALTLVLAACGGSSDDSTGTNPTTSPTGSTSSASDFSAMQADLDKYAAEVTQYSAIKPLGDVSGLKGKTVWYVPIGASVPILSAFGTGLEQAMKAVGVSVHVCDGKFLPTSMATCLGEAVTQGADGVVTGYIDYKLIPNSFDALVSHHIPVLIAGESPDTGKPQSAQLAFNDTTDTINVAEKLSAESVIVDSGGKANILFLGVVDSPSTQAGAAYVKSYVAQNCPGCKFTEIDYNTASINKVPSQVSAALIAHPDTYYVVDELDAAGQGTIQGIQSAGYTNKVKLAGANGDLDALQRIKDKNVQFVDVGVSPIYLGWQFGDGILRMLSGQVPVSSLGAVRLFNASNVGSLDLSPEAYSTNAWYGSDDFKQTFLSAWGVS